MSTRRAAHLVLALAGLALVLFGAWRLAVPHVTCRGVVMHAGDVCRKNDVGQLGSAQVQTYEQRVHASHLSLPVLMVTGLGVTAFAGSLYRQDRRRDR